MPKVDIACFQCAAIQSDRFRGIIRKPPEGNSLNVGSATIGKPKVNAIVDQVCAATASWSEFAERYRVLSGYAGAIDKELAKLRDGMTGK